MPGLLRSSSSSSSSSSMDAIQKKYRDLAKAYESHQDEVKELQRRASEDLVEDLSGGNKWDEEAQMRARSFLEDEGTIFRFYRRSRFDMDAALKLLSSSLAWRMRTDLDMLSLSSLHPLYTAPPEDRPPLFWLGSKSKDCFGRPCGVITLQSLERTEERTLDEAKEFIVASMEIVRRRLVEIRRKYQNEAHTRQSDSAEGSVGDDPNAASGGPLQIVIVFDLLSSSMANLEMELLPFLLDLLKNHFPGMVGAVFVLHYGWIHSGMWGLAKRILPAQALAKIFFPSEKELGDYFDLAGLPVSLGGDWQVDMTEETNDVMARLGKPDLSLGNAGGSAPPSPSGTAANSPVAGKKGGISRMGSYESMADTYFSAAGTPRQSHSRSATPRPSQPATPRGDEGNGSAFRMTAGAASKLRSLQMSRGGGEGERGRHLRGQGEDTSNTLPRVHSLRDFRLDETTPSRSSNALPDDDSDTDSDHSGKKTGQSTAGASPSQTAGLASLARLPGFFTGWRRKSSGHEQRSAEEREKLRDYSDSLAQTTHEQQKQAAAAAASEQSTPKLRNRPSSDGVSSPTLQVDGFSLDTPIAESSIGSATSARSQQTDGYNSSAINFGQGTVNPHDPPRFLSRRSRKAGGTSSGAVSPYNAANPFWGYPARLVPISQADDEASGKRHRPRKSISYSIEGYSSSRQPESQPQLEPTPAQPSRQLSVRRRWRDLFRTLMYLFVLRILAAHRQTRWKLRQVLGSATALAGSLKRVALLQQSSSDDTPTAELSTQNKNNHKRWQEATERHRRLRAAATRSRAQGLREGGSGSARLSRSLARAATRPARQWNQMTASGVGWLVVVFLAAAWMASRRRGLRSVQSARS